MQPQDYRMGTHALFLTIEDIFLYTLLLQNTVREEEARYDGETGVERAQ